LTISWEKVSASLSLNNLEPVSQSSSQQKRGFDFFFKIGVKTLSKKKNYINIKNFSLNWNDL